MYVSLVAIGVLGLFLVYTLVAGKSKGSKRPGSAASSGAKPVETGTAGDDVDYEWIPRSALRTPGGERTSPKQRKNRRAGAVSSDED